MTQREFRLTPEPNDSVKCVQSVRFPSVKFHRVVDEDGFTWWESQAGERHTWETLMYWNPDGLREVYM